jgi:poly-D-alanine transfer protein DltD
VGEILKVMTESLPAKLSPLGPQLTKFFQKEKEPEKTKKTTNAKRQRIITVTEVIDKTPPRASAQKTPAAEERTDIEITPSEVASAEAASIEDVNLESTIEHIDKILLDMATEEATTAAEEAAATASGKGKEIADEASENEAFMFQNLVGEKLSKPEIEELKEYDKSCGYNQEHSSSEVLMMKN